MTDTSKETAPDHLYFYDDWLKANVEGRLLRGTHKYYNSRVVAAKDAEIERLRKLVARAFNEGFGAGMDECRLSRGGVTWADSKSKAALAEKEGE